MPTLPDIAHALQAPLHMLLEPQRRVYWGSLLLGFALALLIGMRAEKKTLPQMLRRVFRWKIWSHASARLDYKLIFAKAVLRLFLIAPWAGGAIWVARWVVLQMQRHLGYMELQWNPWLVTGLYTVSLFIVWDFSRYLLHRWLHTVPLLWEFHKVHHSAEVLTPFSLYRGHPVESVLYVGRGVLTTGVMTGLFFYVFGAQAVQWKLLGVNVFGFFFNFAGGNLRHSAVWLRYPTWLERWLISPAQHQIHHSRSKAHFDSNYGTWLAIWDRLGGSLVVTKPKQHLRYGLPKAELNHDPHRLGSALWGPLVAAARRVFSRSTPITPASADGGGEPARPAPQTSTSASPGIDVAAGLCLRQPLAATLPQRKEPT